MFRGRRWFSSALMKLGSIMAGLTSFFRRCIVGCARLWPIIWLSERHTRPGLKRLLTLVGIVTVVGVLTVWFVTGLRLDWNHLWHGLTGVGGLQESWSATIRNLGLVVAGVLALVFAGWRTWVAHRQAGTALQSLLDERFQKATEMLGNSLLSVRLGGVYGLEALMKEDPDQYYVRGMRLLCAFARSPTHADPDDRQNRIRALQSGSAVLRAYGLASRLRQDVQAVVDIMRGRDAKWVWLENESKFVPDFTGVDLSRGDVGGVNLSGVNLRWADLTLVDARGANLSSAVLDEADLTGAQLAGADLTGVLFDDVTVSGATFSNVTHDGTFKDPAIGLTKRSLRFAIAEEGHLPELRGILDVGDGSYIEWAGMISMKASERA